MAKVLLRQVFQQEDVRTFHDLDLDVSDVTIGSAGDNVLTLSDAEISGQHARIKVKASSALRCVGSAVVELNGETTRKAKLSTGDRIALGSYLITVIEAPSGFDFALLVEQVQGGLTPTQAVAQLRPDDNAPWPVQRSLFWVVLVTLLLTFLAPSLSRFLDRSNEDLAAAPLEFLWATGPLHPAHHSATGNDCVSCHGAAFDRVEDTACTACHDQIGEHADLAVLDERAQSEGTCKSCHEEHQGSERLIDAEGFACASCHETGGLGSGHPEFTHYPRPDQPRIIFDHMAHSKKHFSKTDKSFECAGCHSLDAAGVRQAVGSFEKMCLDCHDERREAPSRSPDSKVYHHGDQIVNSDPVPMFTLPNIDLRGVEDVSIFGHWPQEARKGSKSELTRLGLTPMSEFLLMLDAEAAPALTRLKATKLRLSKLKRVEPKELEDVATVAWGMKRLLLELSEDPSNTLRNRLAPLLEGGLSDRQVAALSGQLSKEFVQATAEEWFKAGDAGLSTVIMEGAPDAIADTSTAENPGSKKSGALATVPGVDWVATGQWRSKKSSLQYAPAGHADAFVKEWIELVARLAGPVARGSDLAAFDLRGAAVQLLDSLVDLDAEGGKSKGVARCTKCHSASETIDGGLQFHWTASLPQSVAHQRARFAHGPHINNGEREDCVACHVVDESSELMSAYSPTSEKAEFVSGFSALDQTACAACHGVQNGSKGGAGQACTTCHNYHVTPTFISNN